MWTWTLFISALNLRSPERLQRHKGRTSRRRSSALQAFALIVPFWTVGTALCARGQTPAKQPAADPAKVLRVLSYNIHHAEGADGKLDLGRIAEVIRGANPDIVALQEVDSVVDRSKKQDQPAELAKMLNMEVTYGPNIDLQGGRYGNALLSRFRIESATNHRIPSIDKGEQRGILDTRLRTEAGIVRVLATHFDHRPDPRERLESIKLVNDLVKGSTEPSLLIGDLNAEFESDVLQIARAEWTLANSDRLPTIPVEKPTRQIDFICSRPSANWSTRKVYVIDERKASDHRPIFAELIVKP